MLSCRCCEEEPGQHDPRDYETDVLSSLLDVIPSYYSRHVRTVAESTSKATEITVNKSNLFPNVDEVNLLEENYCPKSLNYFGYHSRYRLTCIQVYESRVW